MEAFDWAFLPNGGGLLDQDDETMQELMVINWRKRIVENMVKTGQQVLLPHPQGFVRKVNAKKDS